MSNITPVNHHDELTPTVGANPATLAAADRRTSQALAAVQRNTIIQMASVQAHAMVQDEKTHEIDRLTRESSLPFDGCFVTTTPSTTLEFDTST